MAKIVGISLVTLLICVAAQARPQSASRCTRQYTISSGDTCDKISAQQQVSTYQLASLNKLKINPGCDNLVIGDKLCLGIQGNDCTTVYVVKQGDVCATIASQVGIPLPDLLTNNPNINQGCTNIYTGEVLCVAPVNGNSALPSITTGLGGLPPLSNAPVQGDDTFSGLPSGLTSPLNGGSIGTGLGNLPPLSDTPVQGDDTSSGLPSGLTSPLNGGSIGQTNTLPDPNSLIPLTNPTLPGGINSTPSNPLPLSDTSLVPSLNLTLPAGMNSTILTPPSTGNATNTTSLVAGLIPISSTVTAPGPAPN